jgi:hypothetical protein
MDGGQSGGKAVGLIIPERLTSIFRQQATIAVATRFDLSRPHPQNVSAARRADAVPAFSAMVCANSETP